jgi:hypothetical protein
MSVPTRTHGTAQNTAVLIPVAVRTLNLTKYIQFIYGASPITALSDKIGRNQPGSCSRQHCTQLACNMNIKDDAIG